VNPEKMFVSRKPVNLEKILHIPYLETHCQDASRLNDEGLPGQGQAFVRSTQGS
jgi:hypothetical protein